MKRLSLLVVVVLVLVLFGGCAKHRYFTLYVESDLNECAGVFVGEDFDERDIATDYLSLSSEDAHNGEVFAGELPLNLYFYLKDGEGNWDEKLKHTISPPDMYVLWPSGAKVRIPVDELSLDDGYKNVYVRRPPESSSPGWEKDLACKNAKIQEKRNTIMQEGVDEQGRGNTFLGLGLLCILTGSCR